MGRKSDSLRLTIPGEGPAPTMHFDFPETINMRTRSAFQSIGANTMTDTKDDPTDDTSDVSTMGAHISELGEPIAILPDVPLIEPTAILPDVPQRDTPPPFIDEGLSEEDFAAIAAELTNNTGDLETVLLGIIQAAVTDSGFNAGTVRYMCETFGHGDLWEHAVALYQDARKELGDDEEDDELEDPEPED